MTKEDIIGLLTSLQEHLEDYPDEYLMIQNHSCIDDSQLEDEIDYEISYETINNLLEYLN